MHKILTALFLILAMSLGVQAKSKKHSKHILSKGQIARMTSSEKLGLLKAVRKFYLESERMQSQSGIKIAENRKSFFDIISFMPEAVAAEGEDSSNPSCPAGKYCIAAGNAVCVQGRICRAPAGDCGADGYAQCNPNLFRDADGKAICVERSQNMTAQCVEKSPAETFAEKNPDLVENLAGEVDNLGAACRFEKNDNEVITESSPFYRHNNKNCTELGERLNELRKIPGKVTLKKPSNATANSANETSPSRGASTSASAASAGDQETSASGTASDDASKAQEQQNANQDRRQKAEAQRASEKAQDKPAQVEESDKCAPLKFKHPLTGGILTVTTDVNKDEEGKNTDESPTASITLTGKGVGIEGRTAQRTLGRSESGTRNARKKRDKSRQADGSVVELLISKERQERLLLKYSPGHACPDSVEFKRRIVGEKTDVGCDFNQKSKDGALSIKATMILFSDSELNYEGVEERNNNPYRPDDTDYSKIVPSGDDRGVLAPKDNDKDVDYANLAEGKSEDLKKRQIAPEGKYKIVLPERATAQCGGKNPMYLTTPGLPWFVGLECAQKRLTCEFQNGDSRETLIFPAPCKRQCEMIYKRSLRVVDEGSGAASGDGSSGASAAD